MDPVSLSASFVTLLASGAASCKFIYNSLLDFSDAPLEIATQAAKLKCLHGTILSTVEAYSKLPPDLHLDPNLEDQIQRFVLHVEKIKVIIENKSYGLNRSRSHHLRERCLWLSSDRKLRKFYESLDHWNIIFSQTTSTVHSLVPFI